MSTPEIQFDGFSFRYEEAESWALHNITLGVESGEILLVLGRSGCGKSTLALALNGIVPQLLEGDAEGSLRVAGYVTEQHSVSELTSNVGMVFQDPEVQLFALTVEDEVAMSLESFGVPREEMRERVEWAMSVCGLTGMELSSPSKLSGGQKQRVAIAAVIAREPDILVFDEPTGNLDPVGSRSVYETIRQICDDRGRTIVLVEHDLAPVIDLVDRVAVLEKGELIFTGHPRELLRDIDMLRQCGVKIPIATEFALRNENRGIFQYPEIPLTIREAIVPFNLSKTGVYAADQPQLAPETAEDAIHLNGDSTGASQDTIIEFQEVTHQYDTGHKGIDNASLEIKAGEFVAICGMNGAGKTTLALHIMGLLKPTMGKVFVDGEDTRSKTVAEMAHYVGLIFQNPNHQLFKDTVAAEIAFGPQNLGWSQERIEEKTEWVLDLVELTGFEDWDPESLSIGQKQRVAVASVLVMEPRILILDEPTTGQDQRTLKPFMDLVARLNKEGMTVAMITHDMDVAIEYASRIVVMSGGRIIADGRPSDIFLREEVLERAKLHLPAIMELAKALNDDRPVYVANKESLDRQVDFLLSKNEVK